MSHFESLSLDELEGWVETLANKFSENQILCLEGPLGAGKTKLTELLLKHVGVKSEVSSPTFSLINHYHSKKFPFIAHVDLYRIENEDDLESTGFWDLFNHEAGLVIIEWADRIDKKALPLGWNLQTIKIKKLENEDVRNYQLLN